jgi:thymidylate synthase ThyX
MPDTATPPSDPATSTPGLAASSPDVALNETDVYAIHGADPEVLAYAMAKYSRSSLTMRESLAEISSQRAEQFLNTFYFQYGHRSIADLAHIPFAIERLSLLAAIALVDEQRWDGQERSTRYQDFRKSGWYTPALGASTPQHTPPPSRPPSPPTSRSVQGCSKP